MPHADTDDAGDNEPTTTTMVKSVVMMMLILTLGDVWRMTAGVS